MYIMGWDSFQSASFDISVPKTLAIWFWFFSDLRVHYAGCGPGAGGGQAWPRDKAPRPSWALRALCPYCKTQTIDV